MKCTICYERIKDNSIKLDCQCNYYYHKTCIEKWKNRSNTCPLCRKSIDKRKNNITNNISNNITFMNPITEIYYVRRRNRTEMNNIGYNYIT